MEKEKRKFRINAYSIYTIIAYFTIYSIAGFVIETLFGIFSKGVLESRQNFLYGPFCAIYGLGAITMIIGLRGCPKNFKSLFFGGFIVGSIIEYAVSFIGELIFNVKWWDYSNMPFNLNGRICIYYSIFWGILAVIFMQYIHPNIDKFLNKFRNNFSIKTLKNIIIVLAIIQFLDFCITCYALEMFIIRKVHEYDLNVENKEKIETMYNNIYQNKPISDFIYTFFNDKKMIKTFPNLKIEDVDKNIIYLDTLVGDIVPYFYKFNTKMNT